MLILVVGFSVAQVPYGYSLNSNNSSSTYYEKNCRNDTCVVTTCNNGQSCHTASSENSTSNTTTQSQLTDKGSFEEKKLEFKNFWENFLNSNR
jgi:hypothetical protein